jgi:hypothetical protein
LQCVVFCYWVVIGDLYNCVTLASTRLRVPENYTDVLKYVGVLSVCKILLMCYIYIYIYRERERERERLLRVLRRVFEPKRTR